jgi:ABC-2 type transport system ATP-binding protein
VPNAVEIRSLRKSYPQRGKPPAVALDGLDLDIPQGRIFGLLGPNGAGKTTTIKAIAGLVGPDAGSIAFPSTAGRRPQLGAVLEGSRNVYMRLSPWENIRYFGALKGVGEARLRQQADELLPLFEIDHKRHATAQTLSRGMQQKLAIVVALLGAPDLLLLDEPTLGLDLHSSLAIQRLLRELCVARGLTIVITTHQMDVAQALCRRVAIMRGGRSALAEDVDALVDLFRRQDYAARLPAVQWAALQPDLDAAGTHYVELPEERSGQASVRFRLHGTDELYALMRRLAEHRTELAHFAQVEPTLEDIFLHVAAGGSAGREDSPVERGPTDPHALPVERGSTDPHALPVERGSTDPQTPSASDANSGAALKSRAPGSQEDSAP